MYRGHWYGKRFDLDNPPHMGQEHQYIAYHEYLRWQELTDEEKKILEVEAVLDNRDPKEIGPWWRPTVYGRFAKWNMACSCYSCTEKKSVEARRRLRRKLKQDMVEEILAL